MQLILAILLVIVSATPAVGFPAKVVAVIDGDTITAEPVNGGGRIKIRLNGIDAPERKQPGGEAARGFVFEVALFKRVDVELVGKPDRYGRNVAIVYLPNGESLQAALLKAGYAWVWTRYCPDCDQWQSLQDMAKNAGRGLWADTQPVPPWEWRRKH